MKNQHPVSKPHIIINPLSAAGRTGRRWKSYITAVENRLGKNYSVHFTQTQLDAIFSARRAINEGCELVIAVGGDGTINEVVNGFFDHGQIINPECLLGIINSGTGHGFAQSLGLHKSIDLQLDAISRRRYKSIDVGRITFMNPGGELTGRYFVNECQIGIGGMVVKNVVPRYKRFGGKFAFGLIAFLTALSDKKRQFTLEIDSSIETSASLHGIVVGNGAYTGGGMMLTPSAKVDDGLLDVLSIREQSVLQRIMNLSKVHSGRHITSPKFSYRQCTSLSIVSPSDVPIAADGEILGTPPCTISILPHALRVCSQN